MCLVSDRPELIFTSVDFHISSKDHVTKFCLFINVFSHKLANVILSDLPYIHKLAPLGAYLFFVFLSGGLFEGGLLRGETYQIFCSML